jgi:dual specificity MAP kinase phosphatase
MRKRERENPCGVCGHYHKCEEGEICGVCGHRPAAADAVAPAKLDSAFPTEVLPGFLFLGSYDNASRSEVLRTLNITHILNVRNGAPSSPDPLPPYFRLFLHGEVGDVR